MNLLSLKLSLVFFLGGFRLMALDTLVYKTDTDSIASVKFKLALSLGGKITFDSGYWTITLIGSLDEQLAMQNLTILGNNPDGTEYGASRTIYTTLDFDRKGIQLTDGCDSLTVRNIQFTGVGIKMVGTTSPNLRLEHAVLGDTVISNPGINLLIDAPHGFGGLIKHCSFAGFDFRAIAMNRYVPFSPVLPAASCPYLEIDSCLFTPRLPGKSKLRAISLDAGNDEYGPNWDFNGSKIQHSLFIDCGVGSSKGKNLTIRQDSFRMSVSPNDVVHLEEFSKHINVDSNRVVYLDGYDQDFITLGGKQSCSHINVRGNTVYQNGTNYSGLLDNFIVGSQIFNIILDTTNTIFNSIGGSLYANAWGCNNVNIDFPQNEGKGFAQTNIQIKTDTCDSILLSDDGLYYLIYGPPNGGLNTYLRSYSGVNGDTARFIDRFKEPENQLYFRWRIKRLYFNYFEISNLGTENYLEVRRGPEEKNMGLVLGKTDTVLIDEGDSVCGVTSYPYSTTEKPRWLIKERNGYFALLPGGNELNSDIRRTGDKTSVFMVSKTPSDDRPYDYSWRLEPWEISLSIEFDSLEQRKVMKSDLSKTVFPNPVTGDEHVSIRIEDITKVQMLRVNGESIQEIYLDEPKDQVKLSLKGVDPGIYILEVTISIGRTMTTKLIVGKL